MSGEARERAQGPRYGHTSVVCSGCGVRVDLTCPLPKAGWQTLHVCPKYEIQAMPIAAGRPAWAWRSVPGPGS